MSVSSSIDHILRTARNAIDDLETELEGQYSEIEEHEIENNRLTKEIDDLLDLVFNLERERDAAKEKE